MAENANQHYVPQYYFKLFNGGKRQICLLFTKDGRVVPYAPIKGQCARHKFYGNAEIERQLSQLEGMHAATLRAMVETATTGDPMKWSQDQVMGLLQAVVFQRARTMLEVEKESPAHESMFLHLFKAHLKGKNRPEGAEECLNAIESGMVQIVANPTHMVIQQIQVALESAMLLLDMQVRVLRNRTDYPFVFSDSPVIYYNTYYRNVTDRGVLGLQTPGLQVFMPLTSTLQLMLIDRSVYAGSYRDQQICDITSRGDVSQLNALQLHHSLLAVYFANPADTEYVKELYEAHKPRLVKPESEFRVRSDLWVKDAPPEGELIHTFERHLNHRLSLSFVNCTPASPREYTFRRRCPELVEEQKRLFRIHSGPRRGQGKG
jgi:hypothetical protein